MLTYWSDIPPDQTFPKARAAALKAISLDSTLAEAHAALAKMLSNYEWDWDGAEREFQKAIALKPNYEVAYFWHAEYYLNYGRYDEAVKEMEHAKELDPFSLIINEELGYYLFCDRQFQSAFTQLQTALELDSTFNGTHEMLGYAYLQQGKVRDAIFHFVRAREYYGSSKEEISRQLSLSPQDFWRSAIKEIDKQPTSRRLFYLALFHLELGERDQALASLEKAFGEHFPDLSYFLANPLFDPIRTDPRFVAILRKMKVQA